MTSKRLKRFAVLLALCMTIGLTGCNREGGDSSSEETSSADTSEVNETIHKVGYIFHDSADKNGFSGQMNFQRVKASNRSGMETCYIDNVSITDFEKAVKELVSVGCTEIVSGSSVYSNMLDTVARKYMNIGFINYGSTSSPANVTCYTELTYQGAYVAGMVAAYNSEAQKIGFVGDPDLLYNIPSINAAALGMQLVFKDAALYSANATRDDEIEEAIDELLNNGCDVIICYTESPHSIEYCERKGVKYISGLDCKGEEEQHPNMLMYYCCRRDSYFLAQFKQMQLDTWQTEIYTGDMSNGAVYVSGALEAAKDKTQQIRDALIPKITSGQAYVFSGELKDTTGSVRYMQSEIMSDSQIAAMEWYVLGVEHLGSFRKLQNELPPNTFEVKS